jgi:hypothetical protein
VERQSVGQRKKEKPKKKRPSFKKKKVRVNEKETKNAQRV